VLAVVGALGSCGASTLAVALATADGRAARVVECASATASGLAAAATAELGEQAGWLRGRRDRIVLERSAHVLAGPAALALPLPVEPGTVRTVVDVSWEIGQLLGAGARSWLGEYLISGAASVVVATVATVPGMRRLEVVVDLLGADRVVAAVLGLPAKRWDTSLVSRATPALRALGEAGRVVRVPPCRRLARSGLDASPLPPELLRAAGDLLDLADASGRPLITQGVRR
jgi:hypothetical protein